MTDTNAVKQAVHDTMLDVDRAEVANKLTTFIYEGCAITFADEDAVMINATEMAKPFGKTPKDWLRNQSTQEFISTLSAVRQICPTELVIIQQGGNNEQGTWMHEDVAMEFARWLSPAFAIWCNDRIKELLTNKTKNLTPIQMLVLQAQAMAAMEQRQLAYQRQLERHDARLAKVEAATKVNTDYMAVLGYASNHGVKVSRSDAQKLGKMASSYCRNNKLRIEHTKHPVFGSVNIYPESALEVAFRYYYPAAFR